uniref:Uncharacterized protein n=1 Tax=Anopheles atroparvus TaxID=41427 RepID=A0A182JFJ0_ANOAO
MTTELLDQRRKETPVQGTSMQLVGLALGVWFALLVAQAVAVTEELSPAALVVTMVSMSPVPTSNRFLHKVWGRIQTANQRSAWTSSEPGENATTMRHGRCCIVISAYGVGVVGMKRATGEPTVFAGRRSFICNRKGAQRLLGSVENLLGMEISLANIPFTLAFRSFRVAMTLLAGETNQSVS